ncbi:AzlD domain-containing protein [Luteimonas sp. S4-F44]|uniref:AzlD domain-containing protein n=1 Tax=Luteimonas sp. S4-F44 TaxID=2925842 RepID=UPI001F52DC6D|nr:AzlD domain-containing protein [Luteimonas sp. S4-F44]UNK42447.1 AzlD domain-containing protein [Luteimonas sp. S4-F44]
MSATWGWLLIACAVAFAIKLTGYLVPARWLEGARMARITSAMTIGLLAALVVVNGFADGGGVVLDARAGALLVAIVALWRGVPFLGVVVLGALAAAGLRAAGIG